MILSSDFHLVGLTSSMSGFSTQELTNQDLEIMTRRKLGVSTKIIAYV